MKYNDAEQDRTHLADWYARGDLSEAHYQALVNWREDGGGVRKPRAQGAKGKREDNGDRMAGNARRRHKSIFRMMEQINYSAAQACHRLVIVNDPDVRLDFVKVGASICWAEYFGGRSNT